MQGTILQRLRLSITETPVELVALMPWTKCAEVILALSTHLPNIILFAQRQVSTRSQRVTDPW